MVDDLLEIGFVPLLLEGIHRLTTALDVEDVVGGSVKGGDRRSSLTTKNGSRDDSWEVRWEAATATNDDGWTVEIRIPLSEFHVKAGDEAWGVQFVRFSSARQETDVYNYVPSRAAVNGQNESKQR